MSTAAKDYSRRNPNWLREELILALDLYIRVPSPDQNHAEVIKLSRIFNSYWRAMNCTFRENLRNPSGVSMKLGNFQRFDPAFQKSGRAGLSNGAKSDGAIWNEFHRDPLRLQSEAARIRSEFFG